MGSFGGIGDFVSGLSILETLSTAFLAAFLANSLISLGMKLKGLELGFFALSLSIFGVGT